MRCLGMALALMLCWPVALCVADGLTVLPESIEGVAPKDMMRHYLIAKAYEAWRGWQEDFETIKSPEDIAAYQKRLRQTFVEKLGGFPERTPLNPRITGTLEREGYRVEKVLFESQPKHFVSAILFLPTNPAHERPYPGVIVPCGHAQNAKAYPSYQSVAALLALNGMAALVFDPIEQGERMQILDKKGKHLLWGTRAHTMCGVGSILLGRNTARFEIWDGMRALDYLQSRPEVDPERIGCTGNSGGGTQTSFLMALDDRIKAASPSCYLNSVARQLDTATGDAEQNIFGQLAWGMDHADFMMMRAPMPLLICAATEDFFDIKATWTSFRFAKRRYTSLGFSERVDILEDDAGHNYNKTAREGVVRWMSRWLRGVDEPIEEPALELFSDEELWCTPQGQVMLLEGARSTYELNADCERALSEKRAALWATGDRSELLRQVRAITGIRPLAELATAEVEQAGVLVRKGWRIEKLVLRPEPGIHLPALALMPEGARSESVHVYINESGKEKALEAFAGSGKAVLAIDLRGTGETQQTDQTEMGSSMGSEWKDYFAAYELGRSYVGMRAEDLLTASRFAAEHFGVQAVELIAVGNVGVSALHAAALEPQLFSEVVLCPEPASWADAVHTWRTRNQLINTVHGALCAYDLPNLAATLGGKLAVEASVDALGRRIRPHREATERSAEKP